MRYSPSLCRFLQTLEAGRKPTVRDIGYNGDGPSLFYCGILHSLNTLAADLDLTTTCYPKGPEHLTEAGRKLVWEWSDPAYLLIEETEATVAS
jgi:hypothetical protein